MDFWCIFSSIGVLHFFLPKYGPGKVTTGIAHAPNVTSQVLLDTSQHHAHSQNHRRGELYPHSIKVPLDLEKG